MLLRPQSTCSSLFALQALPWLLLLSLASLASATLVNITVDDYYRDPLTNNTWVIYVPNAAWTRGPCLEGCTEANPAAERTYFSTWHGSVYNPRNSSLAPYAQLPFEGVGVYVYCVIRTSSATDLSFLIDGLEVGSYSYRPNSTDGTDTYEYAVPVYANTALAPGKHYIDIRNGIPGPNATQSLAVLDYIVYTRDTTTEPIPATFTNTLSPSQGGFPQPSVVSNISSPAHAAINTAAAISVAGAIVLIVVIALGHRYWKRYRRSRQPPSQQYLRSVEAGAAIASTTTSRFVAGPAATAVVQNSESGVQPAVGGTGAGPSEAGPSAPGGRDQSSLSEPGEIEEVPRG